MAMTTNAVVGVFENRADAESAVDALYSARFRDEEIGIVAHQTDSEGVRQPADAAPDASGAVGGAVTGGAIGAVLGAAAALAIPGVGPILAGGILASALGGAALGAAAGGIIGALTDMGVPEEDARYYDTEFRSGRTLVTVRSPGRAEEATSILRRFGAYDVSRRGSTRSV